MILILNLFQMKVEISFSSLDRRARNFVTETVKHNKTRGGGSCHILTPVSEVETKDPTWHRWNCKPAASPPSKFLHGPVCLRESRTVMYACRRGKCFIHCPCSGCTPNLNHSYSLQERFNDHQLYHHVPHINCEFCSQLLNCFPCFSYTKVVGGGPSFHVVEDVVIKTFEFSHAYQTYNLNKPLKCEDCELVFKKACNRERHYRNVHYKEKFECPVCKKIFGRSDNLKRHTKVHNESDSTTFSTDDNTTNSDEDISSDGIADSSDEMVDDNTSVEKISSEVMDSHVDESDKVEFIDQSLDEYKDDQSQGTSVADDTRVRSDSEELDNVNIDLLECGLCGKKLSSTYSLGVHKKQQKHSCTECQQEFCSKSALSAHRKVKHGRKNFKCSDCNSEFTSKFNLTRHIKQRLLNPCLLCKSVFCNSNDLKCHVYSAHKVKQCEVCGKRYEYIYLHMKNVHGI